MKPLDLWLPPDGAGAPLGCVATTFTFDADFFSQDCLARFLGITAAYGEGDRASDLSLMVEEEERLAEASVSVLVDRSYRPEARNLRWDLLPVAVPGGLLHAKTAVLVWEQGMRLVIGSANLTPAGYRRQIEIVASYDIGSDRADLPRPVAEALVGEIRRIVTDLVPDEMAGPLARALRTLDLAVDRLDAAPLPESPPAGTRLTVAAVRPGATAIEGLDEVWRGSAPRRCRALSPFWDANPGTATTNGVAAVADQLSPKARNGQRPALDLLVTVEVAEGGRIVRAPEAITSTTPASIDTTALKFRPDDADRRLHAKWLAYANDDWVAAMFGSSNLTAKGLGLDRQSHRELNMWIGAGRSTALGKQLMKLVADDGPIDLSGCVFEPAEDEDEVETRTLPAGFVAAGLDGEPSNVSLRIHLRGDRLPPRWSILGPGDPPLLDSATWDRTAAVTIQLGSPTSIPTVLIVRWTAEDGLDCETTWVVNAEDMSLLPPPAELRALPVDALLNVLASTRPLRAALESELRRLDSTLTPGVDVELDPLKRHASPSLLLPRVRLQSAALWGMRERLQRPLSSPDALRWRLFGAMGPTYLAERIVEESNSSATWLPGEARFLLAELALTVRRTDWQVLTPLTNRQVDTAVTECLDQVARCSEQLRDETIVEHLDRYIAAAFFEVQS